MATNCPVEVTPYDQSNLIKNPNVFNLNYTSQDFWSMKSKLVDFIRERFGPEGTEIPNTFDDFVESSIAIMLIENWAFLADTLSFKIDQIANELFIDTVTEVENAFRLARLVGFDPQPPIAARSLWVGTISNMQDVDVFIETPVRVDVANNGQTISIELFQADSDFRPLLDEDIIIPAGATTNQNIVGLEGRTTIDEYTGTGLPSQNIQLVSAPVIWDSIRVEVDGVLWDQVKYFTDSQPRKEYRVEFDSDWNAFIIFGNNRAGLIPSQGSRVRVTYRVGGGTIGNIVSNFVETQRQVRVPGKKFSIPITYRNYRRGEFGYDGDTIEDIRRKLPPFLRTQNRAVTGTDYKTLADQFATPYFGSIGKSTAVLRQYGCAANIIDLYILAKDGDNGLQEASNQLKADLDEELLRKKMITDHVCIRDGVVINVDVSIDVAIDKFYRKFELEFREKISSRINQFFSINNWEYKKDLKDTDLIKALADVKEVSSFEITFTTEDEDNSGTRVTTKFNEIIRPDDVTLSFVYT